MPGISAPLETEWSLLRAACAEVPPTQNAARIRKLLSSQVCWDSLLSLAEHHGVQPILAQSLLSFADQIPAHALITLKQSYQANLHKALLLSTEFVRIVDNLSQAGIDFIPYKGLALAEAIYGDIALRQAGDIDLLIHPTDLKRIQEAMGQIGYVPNLNFSEDEESAYIKSGYECAFDSAAGRNLLEVQWAIEPHFYAVDVDLEGLFRRAQTARVMGVDTKSLSPEDLFVVLGLHAAKHVWGRMIWICDLARISRLPLNWKRIAEHALHLGVVRILRVTLLLAEKLLGSAYPALAAENLPEDSAAETLAEEIEAYISTGKTYDVESLAYFRLMLRLRERRIDRIRFVSRFVFTPGPGEWAVLPLPKLLFPLYRVLRITRLAGRMISGRV
ncbi:MAG TPA: nucleotidyltransferase family protein [Candidatus Sulfotelmatobacter sp.]|nr:nucleotidyltransferase family protein [Candidatus Sulfotelmatobacter sp.]